MSALSRKSLTGLTLFCVSCLSVTIYCFLDKFNFAILIDGMVIAS